MFESLQKRFSGALAKVRGKSKISESDVDEVLAEVRTGLLEADVHFRVTKDFLARVKDRCLREEVIKSLAAENQIAKVLSEELTQILGGQSRDLILSQTPPAVILMCGLQGSGKTTSTIKLASLLKSTQKKRVAVVSVDVQRPAAIAQLAQLVERAGVDVISSMATENPVVIAERALKISKETNVEVLLVDTAGRLQVDAELMAQLNQIEKATRPSEKLLVVDSMMGQQAVEVAEGFDQAIGITGAILTKLDGDARGGAALSLVAVTGKPIKFVGTGERASDFEPFYPDRMASRLLDFGDLLSLIEKAERVISQEEAQQAGDKMMSGDFNLEDFRGQLKMVSRMGSLGGLMKMLPGMGGLKDALDKVDTEKEMKRVFAILDSMTPLERKNPDVLNGSRRSRIARGSGTEVSEINQLIKRFSEARKMMKQFGKMAGLMGSSAKNGAVGSPAQMPAWMKRGGKGFGRKF